MGGEQENQGNNNLEGQEGEENGAAQGEIGQTNQIQEGIQIAQVENDESLTQSEVSGTEQSETDRIKSTYEFVLPVLGPVSSEYGEREVTASVVTAYHKGIDIAVNTGTPIYASTEGEVVISKYSPTYGNYIMLQNNEVKTVYAHCSELLANVGDKIVKGQEIAKAGATRSSNRCSFTF